MKGCARCPMPVTLANEDVDENGQTVHRECPTPMPRRNTRPKANIWLYMTEEEYARIEGS